MKTIKELIGELLDAVATQKLVEERINQSEELFHAEREALVKQSEAAYRLYKLAEENIRTFQIAWNRTHAIVRLENRTACARGNELQNELLRRVAERVQE